ncbi:MAG TPA: MazG-like family protein [Patescibacteria group bacterium]|nr:MazG-like family protein [Patescibacteria group bacterium]
MDIKSIEEKVKSITSRSNFDYNLGTPREKEILARTVKLNEEVGELCNDILSILKLQRKAKLERFDRRNIYQEFADVLITLMQLAIASNVDLDRAISDKLKTISERIETEKARKD